MSATNQNVSCVIYGLSSSENGEIRYIGQTKCGLKKRLCGHKNSALKGGKIALRCRLKPNQFGHQKNEKQRPKGCVKNIKPH